MSELIFGAGSSHGPSVQNQPEIWAKLAEKDVRDPRFNYTELLAKAKPGLEAEVTIGVQRQRHAAALKALKALADRITQTEPDVVIVISNAHALRRTEPQPVFICASAWWHRAGSVIR
jgi:hypothetical protein